MLVGTGLLGLSLMLGCQPEGTASISDQAVSGDMSDLSRLVAKIEVHHRRPFRKPYMDQRNRNMRLLAEKSEAMLADMGTWGGEAQLTGAEGEASSPAVAGLRVSLEELRDAAQRRNVSGVSSGYARVKANYERVASSTD